MEVVRGHQRCTCPGSPGYEAAGQNKTSNHRTPSPDHGAPIEGNIDCVVDRARSDSRAGVG
eukprot:8754610-Lingulodinium_polyedra.AAC.1